MAVFTYNSENTTLILNGKIISDFVTGDRIVLAYPNASTARINGANNSVVIIEKDDAKVVDLTLNVITNSESDDFLYDLTKGAKLVEGSLSQLGTKNGSAKNFSIELQHGSVTTQAGRTINMTDGNATASYVIQFRNAYENK